MASLEDLKEHLQQLFPMLCGDWVSGKKNYERDFASKIGATYQKGKRYWNCIWEGIYIEPKLSKARNSWLDLVRYSECLLKRTPKSRVEVITLFMCYQKQRITDIYAVVTKDLIRKLNLSTETAEDLLRINSEVPRSLNAQANLTERNVREIANFHVC